MGRKFFRFVLFLILLSCQAHAIPPRLSPGPAIITPVIEEKTEALLRGEPWSEIFGSRAASDLAQAFKAQTSVKDQWYRGVCSMFSAIAGLETLIKVHYREDFDLSENFLVFNVIDKIYKKGEDGSDTDVDVRAIRRFGMIEESSWPYESEDWSLKSIDKEEKKKAFKVCGHLKDDFKKQCHLTHLPPGDDRFDAEAAAFKATYGLGNLRYRKLRRQTEIKKALLEGDPVVFGFQFYYGAWHHEAAKNLQIADPDQKKWLSGTVDNPTDKDVKLSKKDDSAHSVLVIGFDDSRGRYTFKNSWGTTDWGSQMEIEGEPAAGYGSIPYEYAHNHGTFFRMSWKQP